MESNKGCDNDLSGFEELEEDNQSIGDYIKRLSLLSYYNVFYDILFLLLALSIFYYNFYALDL